MKTTPFQDLILQAKQALRAISSAERAALCDEVGIHFAYLESVLNQPGSQQSSMTAATFEQVVELAIARHPSIARLLQPASPATEEPSEMWVNVGELELENEGEYPVLMRWKGALYRRRFQYRMSPEPGFYDKVDGSRINTENGYGEIEFVLPYSDLATTYTSVEDVAGFIQEVREAYVNEDKPLPNSVLNYKPGDTSLNSGPAADVIPLVSAQAQALVQRLADWSRKYPRGGIFSSSLQPQMDGELIEMEEAAKALCPPTALQQPQP
jgi:hypothetical protein